MLAKSSKQPIDDIFMAESNKSKSDIYEGKQQKISPKFKKNLKIRDGRFWRCCLILEVNIIVSKLACITVPGAGAGRKCNKLKL